MPLQRCDNGHYFDSANYAACPTCIASVGKRASPSPAAMADPPTSLLPASAAAPDQWRTRRRGPTAAEPLPTAVAVGVAVPASSVGRTERLVRNEIGIDPVVGWLVCVSGPERGADYRLHSERNFIGRGEGMDVRIANDKTVSRQNHLSISHDPKKESFRLLPGEGRGIVYLNGEELVSPMPLKAGDRIDFGQTGLMFVPLCDEHFSWDSPKSTDGTAP